MQSEEDDSWKTAAANNVTCKTYLAWYGAGILWDEQSLAEICVYIQIARMIETEDLLQGVVIFGIHLFW